MSIYGRDVMSVSGNLTTGKPMPRIAGLWGSVMLGDAVMQLYSAINGVITGHYLGVDALGGIGAATIIRSFICAVLLGLMRGFTVPMSNAFGAGDYARMRRLLWPGTLMGLLLAAVITGLLLPFGNGILHLMQTPQENFVHASGFLFVSLISLTPIALFNMAYYTCHATGNGKLASFGQIIVAALTLLLDIVFLVFCRLGAEGAALSLMVSNLVGGILLLGIILRKNPQLKPQKGDFHFHLGELRSLLGNGMSNSTSALLMQIAVLMLQSAVNSMGAVYVNAYAIANRLFSILAFPVSSMDYTMHDYLCQNAGAGKWERIRQGYRCAMLLVLICCGTFLLLGTVFTKELVTFLVDAPDGVLVSLVRQYMLIVGLFTLVYGASTVHRYTPAALGHPGSMALTGGLEGAGRLLACLLVYQFGFIGACLLLPFGWVARGIYDISASYYYLRKVKKEQNI